MRQVLEMTAVTPFMPPPPEDSEADRARVRALFPHIEDALIERFDGQNRGPVFISLTPAMPSRALVEEHYLTIYPFGEPLNRAQLGLLRGMYSGWHVRQMYTRLVKYQLVFTPRD